MMTDTLIQDATQPIAPLSLTAFVIGSALLYAASMIVMKFWGQVPPALLLTIIGILLAGGVWFEIGALQSERLGIVYVLILGIEVVVIALASAFFFGESFSVREIAGAALIVFGTALAWA